MNLNITLKDIKEMTVKQYKDIIKAKCNELAFRYLMNKRRTKGKEIEYTRIQMAQYLLPNGHLEIEDQKQINEIRNKITNITANYSSNGKKEQICICGEKETMDHIYNCKKLNNSELNIKYENIYSENVKNLKMILNRFKQSMKTRNENLHVIQNCDPPNFVSLSLVMDNK